MIELGLSRITQLLHNRPRPWKAIHVAGTNGKGSICAYISAMLHAGGVRTGRFTSPHLIDRWDCINVDEKHISRDLFNQVEREVLERDSTGKIGASEFELLTATAFEAFTKENVDVGVVEVGMGGRLDATNILEKPLVTVISKVGLDHQAFLGNTIEEIAKEKAGILKPGVPCIVDGTNPPVVLDVIKQVAKDVGAGKIHLAKNLPQIRKEMASSWRSFGLAMRTQQHQRNNIACAFETVKLTLPQLNLPELLTARDLVPAVMDARLPGRLQHLDISPLLDGQRQEILLDGAHNADSAEGLAVYVFNTYRLTGRGKNADKDGKVFIGIREKFLDGDPVTWVLAFTQGKDVSDILKNILRRGDRVFVTEFGPVDGMPWVKPMPAADIMQAVQSVDRHVEAVKAVQNPLDAISAASKAANGGPMIVAGSLYLVSNVLKLMRDVSNK
ncbi:FolC bifunctional protein [Rhizodiscina lignyota]|uniref:Dihydrofolate synthetase n=1 Tax=Rhizodiscina lignyota TaxID=1504668 RepID=A0A9P4I4Z6_9PEZI|nr:FolC bifunctional protein [Rhizodiscina lignyota]